MPMTAVDIAVTGMIASTKQLSVVAHNISNVNTTAFKRYHPEFKDLIYINEIRPGSISSDNGNINTTGLSIGLGTQISGTYPILTQGDLTQTENPLDLAIGGGTGRGYFKVELPDGTSAYTRDGTFKMSSTGEIVTTEGYVVSPGISIPAESSDININNNGQIYVKVPSSNLPQLVGTLDIVDFRSPGNLQPISHNLYIETLSSGSPTTGQAGMQGMGEILQGWLENSNVEAVKEMTYMIAANKTYDLCAKVVKTAAEMEQTAVNSM